jgi:nucleoside-diphosphate-sugar epimerase
MKRVVTGGAGFIGSNLVDERRALGQPAFEPERRGEVRRSCLDVTRAKRELGWGRCYL